MSPIDDRMDALREFARGELADTQLRIEPASADASFRSYWRVTTRTGMTRIVMDAPPDKEDMTAWLDIGTRLRKAGLHAPDVFAVDRARGFALIEDLGSRTLLPELNAGTVDVLYADALDALLRMQAAVDVAGLPAYDRERLVVEMELMPEWFLKRHLGFNPECDEWDEIEAAFTFLVHAALEQPRAFVHRDFHSRNLLIVDPAEGSTAASKLPGPGIIDFQDAVVGPLTYDLVSLLRDCYIEWDPARVDDWMEGHRLRLRDAHLLDREVDAARFRRWFDLVGLQRHVKVLGIFCRLWYRDGKAQYLRDLPRVWGHAFAVTRRYPELAAFADLLERALDGRDISRPRDEAAA